MAKYKTSSSLIVNYLERKSFYMLLGTLKGFAGYFARLKGWKEGLSKYWKWGDRWATTNVTTETISTKPFFLRIVYIYTLSMQTTIALTIALHILATNSTVCTISLVSRLGLSFWGACRWRARLKIVKIQVWWYLDSIRQDITNLCSTNLYIRKLFLFRYNTSDRYICLRGISDRARASAP